MYQCRYKRGHIFCFLHSREEGRTRAGGLESRECVQLERAPSLLETCRLASAGGCRQHFEGKRCGSCHIKREKNASQLDVKKHPEPCVGAYLSRWRSRASMPPPR